MRKRHYHIIAKAYMDSKSFYSLKRMHQHHNGKGMVTFMSQRFPKNVTKYVVVLTIAKIIGEGVIYPQSGGFMVLEGLTLDYYMEGKVMAVSYFIGFLLLYCGGILADKYGRRLTWAASLFLVGGGMLWIALAPTYVTALLAAVLLGISSAFRCSSVAWLFDHEGKEGLKAAYGLIHIISVLLLVIGMGITMMGGFYRIAMVLASFAAFVAGGWVITFAENYGNRLSSLVVIAKTGVRQFKSRRVLQLIVLYSLFVRPASWVSGFTLFTYIEKFQVFSPEGVSVMDKTLDTISVVTLFLAGLFLLF
jgi:MFS family permease